MSKECPCYDYKTGADCPKRYVGCHAKCPEYISWATNRQVVKDKDALIRKANSEILDSRYKRRARYLRNQLKK